MLTKVILEKNDGKFIKCIEGKLGIHLGEYEWYLFIQSKDGIYRLRRIIMKLSVVLRSKLSRFFHLLTN